MSERMVELQRARLGLPSYTRNNCPWSAVKYRTSALVIIVCGSGTSCATSVVSTTTGSHHLYSEEEMLQKFLKRLQQQRDGGSTVPTPLARRMLHRQGVGYLDETVAMLTAAAADGFLATVLQQGVACRDRRVAGRELSNEQSARRRKHVLFISKIQLSKEAKTRTNVSKASSECSCRGGGSGIYRKKQVLLKRRVYASKKKNTKKNEPCRGRDQRNEGEGRDHWR
jgi:hypothetical protein